MALSLSQQRYSVVHVLQYDLDKYYNEYLLLLNGEDSRERDLLTLISALQTIIDLYTNQQEK